MEISLESLKIDSLEIDPLEVLDQMEQAYHGYTESYDMVSALNIAIHVHRDSFDNQTVGAILNEMALLAERMLEHNSGLTDATRQRLEHIMADSGLFDIAEV